jgi:hypothetical protein
VSPTPTPSPSTSANGLPFDVNPASGANPGPVGGIGDTIEGLRLDDVEITAVTCPNGEQCPGTFDLRVTNTTSEQGTWEVLAYTYYGSFSTLGNSNSVTLGAGETAVVTITLDSSQDANQGLNRRYTWNWSALPPT